MASDTPVVSRGLFESLTRFAATLVAVMQLRLELLSTDLEVARLHAFSLLILVLAALFFLGLGVGLATILLVFIFWDTDRLLVLSALAAGYLAVGLTVAAIAMHKARSSSRPFAASLSELHKDRQQLLARP